MSESINYSLKTGLLPEDHLLDLAFITSGDSLVALIRSQGRYQDIMIESIKLDRLRYHPGASCLATFNLQFCDPATGQVLRTNIYAAIYNGNKFDEALGRTKDMKYIAGPLTDSVIVDEDHRCLIYEFPNDASLGKLSLLRRMGDLKESVKRHDVDRFSWIGPDCPVDRLRYKPENRYVGLIHSPQGKELVIRFEKPEVVSRLKTRMTSLRRKIIGHDSVILALPSFCDESNGLVGMEKLPGEKLSEILRTDQALTGLKRGVEALVGLHSGPTEGLPPYNPEAKIKGLLKFLVRLERGFATLAEPAHLVAEFIRHERGGQADDSGCLIHGDFHPGQLLMEGDKVYIIDLDCLAVGAPEIDMGNFIAQLVFLHIRQRLYDGEKAREVVVNQYARESDRRLESRLVQFYTVIGLVELAAKQYRRLKPGWPESVMEILTKVGETMERPIEIS